MAAFEFSHLFGYLSRGKRSSTSQRKKVAKTKREYKPQLESLEERLNPSPGAIPRHYPQIRIAQLAYDGTMFDDYEDDLLRNSADLVVLDPLQPDLQHIQNEAPATPQFIYTNSSNVYKDRLLDWLKYADTNALNREDAFFHMEGPTAFSGTSYSSQPVTWFWGVYRGGSALENLVDLTTPAHDTVSDDVVFSDVVGDALYVGFPERFREVRIDVTTAAGSNWRYVLEYVDGLDIDGKPTWDVLNDQPLSLDTTGLKTLPFDPPSDWKAAVLKGPTPAEDKPYLFYVRLRTTFSGGAPKAKTVQGRDYVEANGTNAGTIPAFDSAADGDGNKYLDDTEFYTRPNPSKTARFFYESRLTHGFSLTENYGQMRFSIRPVYQGFKDWAVAYHQNLLTNNPLADGLFMDNSGGNLPTEDLNKFVQIERPSVTSYASDYAAMLNAINQAITPKWILPNTAGGGNKADAVIQNAQAYFEEYALKPMAVIWSEFETIAGRVANRAILTTPAPYAILSADLRNRLGVVVPDDSRTQLATLAYYYLVGDPASTFLNFNGSTPGKKNTEWSEHWSPAAAYDIGQPTGPWSLFASGNDPEDPAQLTYRIYQRDHGNARVLYKPLSQTTNGTAGTTADATATTHNLNGSYYNLLADGSLEKNPDGLTLKVYTSVTLRNGEGAVLVKRAGSGDGFTQADGSVLSGSRWTAEGINGGYLTVQDGRAKINGGGAIATAKGLTLTDGVVEADVVLTSGQSALLLARYQGPGDTKYYGGVLARDASGYTAWIVKSNSGGIHTNLNGTPIPITFTTSGDTRRVRFTAVGTALRLYVDGLLVASANDATYGSGQVGFRGIYAGVTFDNFAATALTAPPAALPGGDRFPQPDDSPLSRVSWVDVASGFKVQGGQAVAQDTRSTYVSALGANQSVNVTTLYGVSLTDVAVEADVTASGPVDGLGLVARYQFQNNTESYYAGVLWYESQSVSPPAYYAEIWKVVNGTLSVLSGSSVFVGTQTAPPRGRLRFEVFGDALRLYVDGVLRSEAIDNAVTEAGTVGVRAGRAGDKFDNFTFAASDLRFADRFSQGSLGGSWTVQADGNGVTVQGGRAVVSGSPGSGTGMAVVNSLATLTDMVVEADVTAVNVGDSATLVARYSGTTDANNSFYSGSLYLHTDNRYYAEIRKRANGQWGWVGQVYQEVIHLFPAADGRPRHLCFEVVANTLSLYADGVLVVSTTDGDAEAQRLTSGKVGIRGWAGTTFDDFQARSIEQFASDAFTQPDGSALGSSWTTQGGAGFTVQSNKAQGANPPTGQVNLATFAGASLADVSVSAVVNVAASSGRMAGVVARYQASQSYYAGVLMHDGSGYQYKIRLYRNGLLQQPDLATATASGITGSSTPRLRLEVLGSSLALYADGSLVARATDTTLTGPGQAGILGTAADTLDDFSALRIGTPFDAFTARSYPLAFDTFRQANGTPLDTSRWDTQVGGFQADSGRAKATGGPAIATAKGLSLKDVVVEADVTVELQDTTALLLARYQGPGDAGYYAAGIYRDTSNNYFALMRRSSLAGVQTPLGADVPLAAGSNSRHLRFEVVGTTLSLYVDGTLVKSATDTVYANVFGGVGIRARVTDGAAFDNFQAQGFEQIAFDNFDQGSVLGPSWATRDGSFTLQEGDALGDSSLPPGQFNIATWRNASAADVSVSALVTVDDVAGRRAGVVARYQGPGYYYAAAVVYENNAYYVRIYRYQGGTETLIGPTDVVLSINDTTPVRLRFEVLGNTLAVYVDGVLKVQTTDIALTGPGEVGIYASANDPIADFSAYLI